MASIIWKRFRKHPGAIVGIFVFALLILSAILVPLSPYDPEASSISERLQSPSFKHPMGTDALGRDLLTRFLYDGHVSLTVDLLVVIISLSIGVPVGAIAGYYGGRLHSVLMCA